MLEKPVKMRQDCTHLMSISKVLGSYIYFSICCNYVITQLHFGSALFQVYLQIIDRA